MLLLAFSSGWGSAAEPPATEEITGNKSGGIGWDPYYYKKRKKKPVSVGPVNDTWTPPPPRPVVIAPPKPYAPQGWASNAPLLRIPARPVVDWAAIRAEQEQRRLEAIAAQRAREEEDDEEIMLLLAA